MILFNYKIQDCIKNLYYIKQDGTYVFYVEGVRKPPLFIAKYTNGGYRLMYNNGINLMNIIVK